MFIKLLHFLLVQKNNKVLQMYLLVFKGIVKRNNKYKFFHHLHHLHHLPSCHIKPPLTFIVWKQKSFFVQSSKLYFYLQGYFL